jgi:hypothetical protein
MLLAVLTILAKAQFNYITNDGGTITITGYTGPGGAVTIPAAINTLPVTSIGAYAFTTKTVTAVTIPDSVTNIENLGFGSCTSLADIMIPNSVTSIGTGAFQDCTSLKAITVDSQNPAYSSLSGVLLNKSQSLLIQCPGGLAGGYTIPNSVTNVADGAFVACTALGGVTIPNSVTSLGIGVFGGCRNLTNVAIPRSLTAIPSGTFYDCVSLGTVTIPDSVSSIGDLAFYGCTGLVSIMIGRGVVSIGDQAWSQVFDYCTSLTAINVDSLNSVYSSADGVLFNKTRTTIVRYPMGKTAGYVIPSDVTQIGDSAFSSCARLTSVVISSLVWNIGDHAFAYCTSLTNVTMSRGAKVIGIAAFAECTSLSSIAIPESVTDILQGAFISCSNLNTVFFRGNAPYIHADAFAYDTAIAYYLPGTTGWGSTLLPTALWLPKVETSDPTLGVGTNGFGFTSTWASGMTVVVEASTNNRTWIPLGTNTFHGDTTFFSDPQWTNYPSRFYRLVMVLDLQRRPIMGHRLLDF